MKLSTDYLKHVSPGAGAKAELHIVEAKALNHESSPITVERATLKTWVQPVVPWGALK